MVTVSYNATKQECSLLSQLIGCVATTLIFYFLYHSIYSYLIYLTILRDLFDTVEFCDLVFHL